MSATTQSPDAGDRDELERLHSRIVDQINDMLIPFQDASYELGRKRGRAENADAWSALEALTKALDTTSWSSWQTTANFAVEWESAQALLKARKA